MSRSRSLLQILSDPQLIDKPKKTKQQRDNRSSEKQIKKSNANNMKQDDKKELDLSILSSQEAKQIQQMRKNQQQLNKNMSEYEQLQLIKLQKQILSYGNEHIQNSPQEKINYSLIEEQPSFQTQKNDVNIQAKSNKLYVYPKDQHPLAQVDKTDQSDKTMQLKFKTDQEKKERQFRSVTEYNERENPWPGKFPLYSKNIDKINLSCLYLKFKQDLINKKDEFITLINNNKTLASPEKALSQLPQPSQLALLNSQKRASTSQDLPPIKKQINDPFNTVAQFNPSSRKIGLAEFQTDFSCQQNIQQQRAQNLQRNLYNQLIQQKLKLSSEKIATNKKDDQNKEQNKKKLQLEETKAKLQIYNLLPQLLKSKQQEIQEAKNNYQEDLRQSLSPQQEERIQKINKIMSMKIKKNRNLKQSQSLQHLDQNKNVIYHIGNQLKDIDKSKNIGQYIDQLKILNENIKKELQQQLKLNQPSLKSKQKNGKSNENIVKYLNKSDYPFYNLSYFKIDQFTNQLQKIHKNPQQTLHQELDQNLQPFSSLESSHLPSIIKQYNNYQMRDQQQSNSNQKLLQTQNLTLTQQNSLNNLASQQKERGRQALYHKLRSNEQQVDFNQKTQQTQQNSSKQPLVPMINNDSHQIINQNSFSKKNIQHYSYMNQDQPLKYGFNLNDEQIYSQESRKYQNDLKQIKQKQLSKQKLNSSSGALNQLDDTNGNIEYNIANKRCLTEQSNLEDNKLLEDFSCNQLDSTIYKQNERDLNQSQESNMSQLDLFNHKKPQQNKAQLYEYFSQTKKQIRFATDTDQVIEEEDLSFDQLKSKKFNGEFNDQLYQDQFVKNFFQKSSRNTVNNSILSDKSFHLI
ncbi:hypothetical protein TTHERM_00444860 (macronuclear) [Tetrahymena thermophila SB210]|uniref:Uncharacterized protein n=1 Tax=Tetrahymena thermophila (strain SB210) TaxID=312017 RepID=I7MLU8_TETTS|nr:hypothetical protein TTHERM_00444860 [Tetrahymena thermophila SB210]EAS03104.1 hypothetical protein TTHERM_00444860 [Tetrahymena thermophila SB210]|eukprot:XP_001023349.1 hypothetical protein TTHERM_00444860 [Tetrahymena thermophila SB210]